MYDVLVIGGGHAGCEAAAAAARRGAHTALLTFDRKHIGAMSCNPSIGGLGKGHLVREVDAFDGVMARAADAAAVHHRMLNRSKGAAVRGPRIQADRALYAAAVKRQLSREPRLEMLEGEAVALAIDQGRASGVVLADGAILNSRTVILATGTFLGAKMFRGDERHDGGRVTERPATLLARQLRDAGLPMSRLKTGTPPRLDGRTIDWGRLEEQASDTERWSMSALRPAHRLPQIACAITRTNDMTHAIIRDNLGRSPLFTGAIDVSGPRYCPSIEDKVQRFGDRDGHQIFLEPEGLNDSTVYPNGLSTSLPAEVQQALVNSIAGLERAALSAPGYAVEYDYVDPRALTPALQLRAIRGVFCAGQINGTTGYEEAAGQGLIAGLNAAAEALALAPVLLDRASSYLGVMIDDLVLQGVTEPYRMLTARAEYRLSLRADNAETRLREIARAAECLSVERLRHQEDRAGQRLALRGYLEREITAAELVTAGTTVAPDGAKRSAWAWLRSPEVDVRHVAPHVAHSFAAEVIAEIVEDARYAPYIERQATEVRRLRSDEAVLLPPDLCFAEVAGLSTEMINRLSTAQPPSLGAAARIRGITPAALSAVLLYARRLGA